MDLPTILKTDQKYANLIEGLNVAMKELDTEGDSSAGPPLIKPMWHLKDPKEVEKDDSKAVREGQEEVDWRINALETQHPRKVCSWTIYIQYFVNDML